MLMAAAGGYISWKHFSQPANSEAVGDGLSDKSETQTVNLFYYNKAKDTDAAGQIRCSPDSVLPVERQISGKQLIAGTISLLLKGDIRESEKDAGFETEFPHPDFRLKDVALDKGTGQLTLSFTSVPGFTTGGSCRTGLLYAQIAKTALQFDGVREVALRPEFLFQP